MVSSFLEAPILAWTDRRKAKRHLVVFGGLAIMALSVALVSFVHGALGLTLAMLLYGPASGLALGTGEAMLVDGVDETTAARRLARWTIFASLGDVLAPASLALMNMASLPWRTSFRIAAAAIFAVALLSLLLSGDAGDAEEDDEPEEPVLAALRAALGHRRLIAWLAAAALCTLLDEMLAVLAAIFVTERFSTAMAAPTLIAFSFGSVVGAIILDRALARTSRNRALTIASAVCAAAMAGWLTAPSAALSLAWAFVVGVSAGPLHPLAKAEAFACLPSRPGLVNGASQAFVAIDLLAPVILAWIAERFGARVALASMALQPLSLLAMAMFHKNRHVSPNFEQ
jgi:MFS family permease